MLIREEIILKLIIINQAVLKFTGICPSLLPE